MLNAAAVSPIQPKTLEAGHPICEACVKLEKRQL
jgi:hypothetical protein